MPHRYSPIIFFGDTPFSDKYSAAARRNAPPPTDGSQIGPNGNSLNVILASLFATSYGV